MDAPGATTGLLAHAERCAGSVGAAVGYSPLNR